MGAYRPLSACRGFTLAETVAAVASLGLLGTIGLAGLSGARRADAHANCSARLAAIGAGNGQFALANNDRMLGLTWEKGGANSQYADLNALQGQSQQSAHAAQVIDILRRRGRPDIPVIPNWVPHALYTTTALLDFQNRALADPFNVCPSDDNLNKWRRWPAAFDQGRLLPIQPSPSAVNKRWPYSSSYLMTASAWDISQSVFTPGTPQIRVTQQGNTHGSYTILSTASLGPSRMSLVALPSQKVQFHDAVQRHLAGPQLFFMHAQATLPVLFFDGSVRVKTSQDSRMTWVPQFPTHTSTGTQMLYQPAAWEPPTSTGAASQLVDDPYRFTRDGLLGWDFEN